jgi:hypothetical protein
VGYRLAIGQGGSLFFGGGVAVALGPGGGAPGGVWDSFAFTGIVDSDFFLLDGAGTLDFSAAGDPITFGFLTTNSVTLDNTSTMSGIDNWSVTVDPVPEPSTALLLAGGLLALVMGRKHRTA